MSDHGDHGSGHGTDDGEGPDDHASHAAGHAPPAPAGSRRQRGGHAGDAVDEAPRHGAHAGHDKHAGHSPAMFRDRSWRALVLTIPIAVYAAEVQEWLGYEAPRFPGSDMLSAVLGTIVFLYGGLVFLRGATAELRGGQPGMMTLISLAISVAFVTSWAATLGVFEVEVWWELATLITIMLFGHWLEMRSIAQARGALDALGALLPDEAERVGVDGALERIPSRALRSSDIVLVRPGGRVPADGTVLEGHADVDESMLTGESASVAKEPGAVVSAGTVIQSGSVRVRVAAVGEATTLAGIMRLVAEAQASGSRAQALADRAAAILFYVALVAGGITLTAWVVLGDTEGALVRTVTVLVIACPHALGLAIPLVIAISTTLGARNGLLVKDRMALERARDLDVVIFDKTGTLTEGRPVLTAIAAVPGTTEGELVALAAAVEADSEHPLGRAVVSAAAGRGLDRPRAERFEQLAGRGARAHVGSQAVAVGGPALLAELGVRPPSELQEATEAWAAEGRTVLHVVADGAVLGALALEDAVRAESREAVDRLHALGVRVAMITGDSAAVARSVAGTLGIDEVAAEVLPRDKDAAVGRFQRSGAKVAMVGDGVNDAPALARADVGIAIGSGTDVAVETAGIVLISNDPRDVVAAIHLSRAAYRKMIQNLVWATGYNVVAIPVAAGVLVPWGIELPMSVGAIAMSVSTIVVALNAQLLRGLRLRPRAAASPLPVPSAA